MVTLPWFTNKRKSRQFLRLQKLARRPSLRLKSDLQRLGIDWRKVLAQ